MVGIVLTLTPNKTLSRKNCVMLTSGNRISGSSATLDKTYAMTSTRLYADVEKQYQCRSFLIAQRRNAAHSPGLWHGIHSPKGTMQRVTQYIQLHPDYPKLQKPNFHDLRDSLTTNTNFFWQEVQQTDICKNHLTNMIQMPKILGIA